MELEEPELNLTTKEWLMKEKKLVVFTFLLMIIVCVLIGYDDDVYEEKYRVPKITITSMDFTILNVTEARVSAKWDLLIKIPGKFDLKGSLLCNITIANSSAQRLRFC